MSGKIIFIQSHPIQYFAPLFQLGVKKGLPIVVLYCSDESLKAAMDVQFGKELKWDIPLLGGYESRFIKNISWKPSIHNGFFGLINMGLIRELKKAPKSLVIVPGWNYASYWIGIFAAKYYGHKVALRGESPLNQELLKSKVKRRIRKWVFGKWLFPKLDFCLYIGERNKAFYKYYDIPDAKLIFTPYAVDNSRFSNAWQEYEGKKKQLKQRLGLKEDCIIVLFSAKYIQKKRPLDLLKAYRLLGVPNLQLVLVGDGNLKAEMLEYISKNNLENVILTGFINQSEIVKYYAAADLFVMCSGDGETWGLSVNEAMNFHLPVIVSEIAGCSVDLVRPGINGLTFTAGNIEELASCIKSICEFAENEQKKWGDNSAEIVSQYSYDVVIDNLKTLVN